jgi:hypothetical protein
MAYTIIWNGRQTGICVPDKKVSISYFREFEPTASPIDNFEFIEIVEKKSEYKKVKSVAEIKADPRISEFIKNYDGHGVHMVSCKDGFMFDRERTIDIGSVKEICDAINFNLCKI